MAAVASLSEGKQLLDKSLNEELLEGLLRNERLGGADFKALLLELCTKRQADAIVSQRELLRQLLRGNPLSITEMQQALTVLSLLLLSSPPKILADAIRILETGIKSGIFKEASGRVQQMQNLQEFEVYLQEVSPDSDLRIEILRGLLANRKIGEAELEKAIPLLAPTRDAAFIIQNRELLSKFLNSRLLSKEEGKRVAKGPKNLLDPFSEKEQNRLDDVVTRDKADQALAFVRQAPFQQLRRFLETVDRHPKINQKIIQGLLLNEQLTPEEMLIGLQEIVTLPRNAGEFLKKSRSTLAKLLQNLPVTAEELQETAKGYQALPTPPPLPEKIQIRLVTRPSTDLALMEIERGDFAAAFQIQAKAVVPLDPSHPLYDMDQAILEGSSTKSTQKQAPSSATWTAPLSKGGIYIVLREQSMENCSTVSILKLRTMPAMS